MCHACDTCTAIAHMIREREYGWRY